MNFTAQTYNNHNHFINTRYIIISCIILSVTIPLCCNSSRLGEGWFEQNQNAIASASKEEESSHDGEGIRAIRSSFLSLGRASGPFRKGQGERSLEVYMGIAAPGNNQVVIKAFNKTLANVSSALMAGEYGASFKNVVLQPFFIELPENEKFSSSLLVSSCAALNGRKVAGLAVLGRSEAAATAALAAAQAGIPVLRAAPKPVAFHTTLAENIHPLEARLEITARETLQALRALLLHTHWHSFTILADFKVASSIALRKDLVSIFNSPPLSPTILSLPASITQQSLFRRLADVSRLTRGVVVLFCNVRDVQRVLDQAKKLNMLDGHFVWLWIDTDLTMNRLKNTETEDRNSQEQFTSPGPDPFFEIETVRRAKEEKHAADQRERQQGVKKMDEILVDRNKRNNKSIQKLDGAQKEKDNGYTETEERRNESFIGFNESLNYTRRKDEVSNYNNVLYSTTTPVGLRTSLRSPNLIYIKNRQLISDKSLVFKNKIRDGQFRDDQSDFNDLSKNIIISNNNYSDNTLNNNDFININLKEGVESSKIALNHKTNSKTPESNIKIINNNNNNKAHDINNNMYISDSLQQNSNNYNNNKIVKRSDMLLDNVNMKTTARSLSVFSKLSSLPNGNSRPHYLPSGVHRAEKRTERLWSFNKVEGEDDVINTSINITNLFDNFPVGLLALRPLPSKSERQLIRGAVRAMTGALRKVLAYEDSPHWESLSRQTASCWNPPTSQYASYSADFVKELNQLVEDSLAGNKFSEDGTEKLDRSLVGNFEILNLVPDLEKSKDGSQVNTNNNKLKWRSVGRITGKAVQIETIVWPGGDIIVSGLSSQARSVFRIVTALAPPFVMEGELDEDGQCLRGLPCHRVLTSDKDNLTLVFNEMETQERMEEEAEEVMQGSFFPHLKYQSNYEPSGEKFLPFPNKYKYRTNCCYGLSMDLLENIAEELEFDFHLYIVSDGMFGHRKLTRKQLHTRDFKVHYRDTRDPNSKSDFKREFRDGLYGRGITEDNVEPPSPADMKWNGLVGDLISGAAHMSFAALSVSSARSEVIDFSVPYFFSEVSFLAAPPETTETPLLAFLLPFSPELWITIFTSLNVTAIAVAIYEWLSPFGLNPWGRQRSKNFSMSSALWVMWGLLCGHLVAFKAPKSWPNKFLINVWGGFSVIFVASYTANIAALYAGLFFQNAVADYSDKNLLTLRVGAPKASAAEYYIQRSSQPLWDHMKKYALADVEDGIRKLKNGSLDLLVADTPVLDYYRATDHGCKLQRIGEAFYDDTYAVAMAKGFPLKDSISALISKYLANGYMDILQEKWYGGLPCFKLQTDFGIQPRPLGVAAVAGVFILLGVGMVVGCLILLVEHLFYRYTLPILRHKPKGTIWRSRNIMFFSQKLYRFINCVELVSPHHAARELVHTLRQGQITSLFQKSVKRKEHEQRRRRKSKAQFFEMIQEIRRVQQEERDQPLEAVTEIDSETASPTEGVVSPPKRLNFLSPLGGDGKSKSPLKSKIFSKELFKSPRAKNKKRKQSTSGLNVRRFSTDSVFSSHSMLRFENTSVAIGRRLSKDTAGLSNSPPDINSRRSSYMDFDKLGSRSPNVSSDSLDVKDKVATIPKYRGKQYLDSSPSNYATVNKNRLGLGGQNSCGYPMEARSFQNVSEEIEDKSNDPQTSTSVDDLHSKPEFAHSELQKKHKKTFDELQEQLSKRGEGKKPGKLPVRRCVSQQAEGNVSKKNHQIKIQIEDHSSPAPNETFTKQRHKSLDSEETLDERRRRPRTPECFPKDASRSLDKSLEESSEHVKDLQPPVKSRGVPSPDPSCRLTHDANLPPAPPYPNVVPRTSDGKSPLERLTKEELVLLWRSSESELRSHFLTALREKENSEPP